MMVGWIGWIGWIGWVWWMARERLNITSRAGSGRWWRGYKDKEVEEGFGGFERWARGGNGLLDFWLAG